MPIPLPETLRIRSVAYAQTGGGEAQRSPIDGTRQIVRPRAFRRSVEVVAITQDAAEAAALQSTFDRAQATGDTVRLRLPGTSAGHVPGPRRNLMASGGLTGCAGGGDGLLGAVTASTILASPAHQAASFGGVVNGGVAAFGSGPTSGPFGFSVQYTAVVGGTGDNARTAGIWPKTSTLSAIQRATCAAVVPTGQYRAAALISATGTVRLYVAWFDAAGAYLTLSASAITRGLADAAHAPPRVIDAAFTAPANAAFALVGMASAESAGVVDAVVAVRIYAVGLFLAPFSPAADNPGHWMGGADIGLLSIGSAAAPTIAGVAQSSSLTGAALPYGACYRPGHRIVVSADGIRRFTRDVAAPVCAMTSPVDASGIVTASATIRVDRVVKRSFSATSWQPLAGLAVDYWPFQIDVQRNRALYYECQLSLEEFDL